MIVVNKSSASLFFILTALLGNARSISGQKEGIDKITLALLDIRDLLAQANGSQEDAMGRDVGTNAVNKSLEFSVLVNATTNRLNELGDVTTKHGELLAYLLNRVNEIHDGMEVLARELVSRDDAKNDIGAMIEAMAKGMEQRDLTVKRLQESFAAMAKEVLLKDLVTMELRDRMEEMNESLQAKMLELRVMQDRLDVLTTEMSFLKANCCSYFNNADHSLETQGSDTFVVYANNSVKNANADNRKQGNKTASTGMERGCVHPYKTVGRGCYYVHMGDARSWSEAREFCRRHLKGDLAEPEDLFSLRAHLQGRQETAKGYFWLGGTDSQNPGIWRWASGTPVSLGANAWAAGQPNGKEQHCLYLDSSKQYKAGNLGCQNQTYFICQMKLS